MAGSQNISQPGNHEQPRSELELGDTLTRVTAENAELIVQRCAQPVPCPTSTLCDRELSSLQHDLGRIGERSSAGLTLSETHCRDNALLQADILQTQLTALEAALKASVRRGTTLSARLQASAGQ